jgi:hypothetical protein
VFLVGRELAAEPVQGQAEVDQIPTGGQKYSLPIEGTDRAGRRPPPG